ncbi:hypothetical protein [uncultured Bacteroides sp.]|uniref:hypothetical protein n=1 Tax=uncultured Bacteroides sp. TaxID=162156 RepID=UPI002AAC33CA|nr:hypothetical protein [uncultured Bacteroides sp.]
MQYKIDERYRFYDNYRSHILRKSTMINLDTVHLLNKNMQTESIIIKEIRQNVGMLNGQKVIVHPHIENDSLLIEVIDHSKNINAFVFIFTLTGSLLQMVHVTKAKTFINLPLLPNQKCLMNIQFGKNVFTWTIAKQ